MRHLLSPLALSVGLSLSTPVPVSAGDPANVLKTVRNATLEVTIRSDSSTVIRDLAHGRTWETGPVALQQKSRVEIGQVWLTDTRDLTTQYPGRFAGVAEGDDLRFTLKGRQDRAVGTFLVNVSLEDEWLVYRVKEIDDSIPSLVYPPPIKSEAIVIPRGVGEIHRDAQLGGMYPRNIYPFYTRLNMRFLGGLKAGGAWIGIFDEGFEDAMGFVANRTATPILTRTLDEWRHEFTWRMTFIEGDYVDLAKTYRQWIQDIGWFVSLEEHDARFYPRLFREAGALGQALYLAAEAIGLGCYFDDSMHALLGLDSTSLQSLYHFTVGRPVHDPRLSERPAHPAPRAALGRKGSW